MTEKLIIDYLADALRLPVYAERPEQPEAEYLIVEKTGGRREDHVDFSTIAVQSYAGSMYRASEISELVKTAMSSIIWLTGVAKCDLNSEYNFTNQELKEYRYQAVFDLVTF